MPDPDADGSNLALIDPDAGETVARGCFHLMPREQFNQQRFEPAQVTMQVLTVTPEVEQKVTDQLTRAVVGGLATAINFEKWMRQMLRAAKTRLIGRASDGVDRIVLEQEQRVRDFGTGTFALDNFFLARKRVWEQFGPAS
jgi:hypothetical protein